MGALEDLVDAWRERHVPIASALQIDADLDTLAVTTRVTRYRTVQECLTNVAMLTLLAGHVQIAVAAAANTLTEERSITLTVEDDGRAPKYTRTYGFGLVGMRERVRALGGLMRFERTSEGHFACGSCSPTSGR